MISDYLRKKLKSPAIRDTSESSRKSQVWSFIRGFLDALDSERPNTFMLFNRKQYIDGYTEGSIYRDTVNGISPFCLLIHKGLV